MQNLKHIIMKRNLFFLLTVVAACTLVLSCKKDKNDNPDEKDPDEDLPALTNVIGYWLGVWGPGSADPNKDYAFLVKEQGNIIIVYANSADTTNAEKAYGTWTFDPGTKKFTAYYAYDQDRRYSTSGTLIHRRLEGTWGSLLSTTGGGTYKVRFKQ